MAAKNAELRASTGITFDGTDQLVYLKAHWNLLDGIPSGFTPVAHAHGNITDDGKIGATSNLVVITTTNGVLTTLSRSGVDSRTSFPPSSHATNASTYGYGDATNAGHLRVGKGLTVSVGTVSLTTHDTPVTISSSTTLALATHADKTIMVSNTATITIPSNASVAFPVGTHIDFISTTTSDVAFTPASDVTLYSETSKRKINAQYEAVTLIKTATDVWYLIGALKS